MEMGLADKAKTRHHAGQDAGQGADQVFGKKWLASSGAVTGLS